MLLAGPALAQTKPLGEWSADRLRVEHAPPSRAAAESLARDVICKGVAEEEEYPSTQPGPAAPRRPIQAQGALQRSAGAANLNPQMRAYGDLVGSVSRSADQFARDNVSTQSERDTLSESDC